MGEHCSEAAQPAVSGTEPKLQGARIFMTDSEYAAVKLKARFEHKSVVGYVRHLALHHPLGVTLTPHTAADLRRVGYQLNRLVHKLHIVKEIQLVGSKQTGRLHREDVTLMLARVRTALEALPPSGYVRYNATPRGEGLRKMRGSVRCTEGERQLIRERAESVGLSQYAFIRAVTLGRPLERKAYAAVIHELARIDNNLQQLFNLKLGAREVAHECQRLSELVDGRIRSLSSGRKRRRAA